VSPSRPLQLGSVVWAELEDPNGYRKVRPGVVVTPTADIHAGKPVRVVAITTRLPNPLPDDYVLLPWDAREGSLGPEAPVCGRRKLAGGNPGRRCATGGRHPAAAGDRRTADEDLGRPAAALGNTSPDTSAWRPGSPAFLSPTGRDPSRRRRWSGRG